MKEIHCAIYTRKSNEEGLRQEFNTLHAQREACEAYIKSQKHEGWEVIPTLYDDGGFSGGNMERPALKALMDDVDKGKVDVIVVYKVDRLTRSLADFAKLVEVMDKQEISFVSITQQFNTTTSMGRLTLNVLLSFAQFEREVTGERIRDKIAMSKKKGKWMGGFPPLGYDCIERKLKINKKEAEELKYIFEKYIEFKSVLMLRDHLTEQGIFTKHRKFSTGREIGSKPYTSGNLYRILQNKIYIGEIVHYNKSYKGEHKAILKKDFFDKVQKIIADNRRKNIGSQNAKNSSILASKVYDDCGNSMSAKHSNTRKRMYRYYTSQAIIQGYHHKAGSLPNIPAEQLENLVKNQVKRFLKSKTKLQKYLGDLDIKHQVNLMEKAKSFMNGDFNQEKLLMRYAIHRVEVADKYVKIEICKDSLLEVLQDDIRKKTRDHKPENIIYLEKNIELAATNNGSKVVIGNVSTGRNEALVKAIARSFYWNDQLVKGERKSYQEIAKHENITSPSYVGRIVRLRFLSPQIIEMILDGTHPQEWTVEKLFAIKETDWDKQRKMLGLFNSNQI